MSWFGTFTYGDSPPLSPELIAKAERSLGYKLPQSYLDVLKEKNGGYLKLTAFPTSQPTQWAPHHVCCSSLMGLGGDDGIDGPTGSKYLIDEWDYPDIGVVISSEGHTAFMLDYSACGPRGEPTVVYVETDPEVKVIQLAPSFAEFLAGLVDHIEEDEEDE